MSKGTSTDFQNYLKKSQGCLKNVSSVTTAMDGHLPFLGWLPTNPRMVTHHKEVNYKLRIWHSHLTNKNKTRLQLPGMVTYHNWDGHPPEGHIVQT